MRAQVRNVFEKYYGMSERNMIEQDQMLMDLTHIPDVGDYWKIVFSSQQTNG